MGNLCARLRNRLPEMAAGVAPDMPAEQESGAQRFPPLWQVGDVHNTTGGLLRGSRRFPLEHPPERGRVEESGWGRGRFCRGLKAAHGPHRFRPLSALRAIRAPEGDSAKV